MKHFFRLTIILPVLFLSSLAYAEESKTDDREFETALEKFKLLQNEGKCDEYWNVFWPLAKKGNLNARQALYYLVSFKLHMDDISAPGKSRDEVTQLRDYVILAVHSLGAKPPGYEEIAKQRYEDLHFRIFGFHKEHSRGYDFYKCYKETPSPACADIAVKHEAVPSFEDYASEIDAAIAQGKKSICIPHEGEDEIPATK